MIYCGVCCHPYASVSWWAIHSALGCAVTPNHRSLRRGVLQDQESVQQAKRDRRDHEQIHRCDAVGMIVKKGLPALRRRRPSLRHVFCDGGLPDIDAKLEQFAVDPGCAPKRVCDTHLADKAA